MLCYFKCYCHKGFIVNILTQQVEWRDQFDQIDRHVFFYDDFAGSIQDIKNICSNNNIDLVLCFNFEIQSKFSDLAHTCPSNFGVPWLIPTRLGSEMENKNYFYQWMFNNNFSQYMPRDKHISDYPYVLKTGNGYSARYVHLVKNANDLQQLNLQVENKQFICQEYIEGLAEYAFHFIAVNGAILKAVTYKHIFSELPANDYYIKGRGFFNKQIEKVDLEARYYYVMHSIIQKCSFTGIGCIDFKIANNQLFIFEFNSRMGGSLLYFDHILYDLDDFMNTLSLQLAKPLML